MYTTDGTDIIVPRGDSAGVKVKLLTNNGVSTYTLQSGETARMDVYLFNNTQKLFTKTASTQASDGTVTFNFSTSETGNATRNKYKYSVYIVGNSATDTVISGTFEIR